MRLAFAILFCLSIDHQSMAQCSSDELLKDCILKRLVGFNFLKTFKIENDGSREKIEYSYVFTKGTSYMIGLCTEEQSIGSISIELFDSGRNKVASSNNVTGQSTNGMMYQCNSTGIYYISFALSKQGPKCAGSVLGFKR